MGGFFAVKNKKRLWTVVTTVIIMTFVLTGCSSNQAVGILDMNKVMTESPKAKQLQEQFNAKGKELSDTLEKDKTSLSAEEFQKRQQSAYGELEKVKQDLEGQIDNSIKQALDQVVKEKKLGVVLYKESVAQGGTDITDDVIKKMQ